MKVIFVLCTLLLTFQMANCQAKLPVIIESPNKNLEAIFNITNEKLKLDIQKDNELIFSDIHLGLNINGKNVGENVALVGQINKVDIFETYSLVGNHPLASNNYTEFNFPLKSNDLNFSLLLRIFDDGIAIRYVISAPEKLIIESDNTAFSLPENSECYWALYSDDNENVHFQTSFAEMPENKALLAPLTVKFGKNYLAFSEADNRSFPDMSWQKSQNYLKANFTTNPNGWEVTNGTILSPWRMVIIADNLNQLVNSDLIMNLCEKPDSSLDFNWVKPGRVLWQWWSIGSPKFEDQKSWYDAAARLKWEYYLIDDGWRFWKHNELNEWECLKNVIDYGNTIGVKSIIWVNSNEMRTKSEMQSYLSKVKEVGAVGIKIDFIPPATPEIIKWYQIALEETYKLKLMCNFHGCNKPTGLRRTWPHELTREGVRGNEYHLSRYKRVMPKSQDEIIPFTRLLAGPADMTPVILNKTEINGFTWTHELAQAIVYLSPLTHFADSYSEYINNPSFDFLTEIPTTWDETIVLPCSEIGKVAAFARRKGNEWWVGVLNGEIPTNISFDLRFVNYKNINAQIIKDKEGTPDAFEREEKRYQCDENINLELQSGGGFFMRIKEVN